MKSTDDMFSDFKKVAKKVKANRPPKNTHYEVSFESKRDFNRFIRNISVLSTILNSKPQSIYQLAKMTNCDLSNLKKLISFFEEIGALQIKKHTTSGRIVKTPVVNYQKIEFDLTAA